MGQGRGSNECCWLGHSQTLETLSAAACTPPPPPAHQVLRWLNNVREQVGDDVTKEQLSEFVWATLKSGKVRVIGSRCCCVFAAVWPAVVLSSGCCVGHAEERQGARGRRSLYCRSCLVAAFAFWGMRVGHADEGRGAHTSPRLASRRPAPQSLTLPSLLCRWCPGLATLCCGRPIRATPVRWGAGRRQRAWDAMTRGEPSCEQHATASPSLPTRPVATPFQLCSAALPSAACSALPARTLCPPPPPVCSAALPSATCQTTRCSSWCPCSTRLCQTS